MMIRKVAKLKEGELMQLDEARQEVESLEKKVSEARLACYMLEVEIRRSYFPSRLDAGCFRMEVHDGYAVIIEREAE